MGATLVLSEHVCLVQIETTHRASVLVRTTPFSLICCLRCAIQDEKVEELVDAGNHPVEMEHPGERNEEAAGPQLTREEVVHEFFSYLFPDSFQLALPVLKHKVICNSILRCLSMSKPLEFFSCRFLNSFQLALPMLKHPVRLNGHEKGAKYTMK